MFEKMDHQITDFIGQFEMGSVLKKETTLSSIVTFDQGPRASKTIEIEEHESDTE